MRITRTTPVPEFADSPIVKAVLAIQGHDEVVYWKAQIPPPYPDNRFLRVSESVYTKTTFVWENYLKLRHWPSAGGRWLPRDKSYPLRVSLADLEAEPVITLVGDSKRMPHFKSWGACALVTERVFDCMVKLDRDGFESREVEVGGAPTGERFFLTLPRLCLEVIDATRSDLVLKTESFLVNGEKRVSFGITPATDFCLRGDLPREAHVIAAVDAVGQFWSQELVDAVTNSGAHFIKFWQAHKFSHGIYLP